MFTRTIQRLADPLRRRGPAAVWGAAGLAAWTLLLWSTAAAQGPRGPSPVEVAPVTEQSIVPGQTFVGTVNPLKTSIVGSAVDGRVVEFPVKAGDWVTEGQPLAQLLTGTLEIERAGAIAELKLRQAELDELKNGTRPEEIAQARARMLAAEARREFVAARHRRNQNLYDRSAITEEQLSESTSAEIAAQQSFLEAQEAYNLAVKGPRVEVIAQAEARVDIQKETIRSIEDRIKKHTLRSPFDGYISEERTEVGQWLKSGEVAAVVVNLNPVEIETFVPEAYIHFATTGMEAEVRVDALPGRTFAGKVARVLPKADSRSRTFPVHVQVPNPDTADTPQLKAGMLARVTLAVGARKQATLVHKDALVLGGESPTVLVVDYGTKSDAGKVRIVPVQTGVSHGQWIEAKGEIKPGEHVITRGNERLRPGQDVKVVRVARAE